RKARTRLKRGGSARIESLDFESAEGELRALDLGADLGAEQFFLREWIRGFFELAVAELKEQLLGEGKVDHIAFSSKSAAEEWAASTSPRTRQGLLRDEAGAGHAARRIRRRGSAAA